MKKLAARDYEDLLQVDFHHILTFMINNEPQMQNMIPVVEGLLPEPHNSSLITLLYRLGEWHALAKLRMHTDVTLKRLEQATVVIGKELRSFRDTSSTAYTCKELPGETSRRVRRWRRGKKRTTHASTVTDIQGTSTVPPYTQAPAQDTSISLPAPQPRTKYLNLCTYKLHALGDYVRTICLFGTTDSYSTQIVSKAIPNCSLI